MVLPAARQCTPGYLVAVVRIIPYVLLYLVATSYFTSWHCRLTWLYLCWYLYDAVSTRGGRRSEWVRNLRIFGFLADHLPAALVKTCDLDPDQKYILGSHPHGAFCLGAFLSFSTDATGFSRLYPGIKSYVLTHPFLHQMPGNRELLGLLGVCDVSKDSIDYLMGTKGNMAVIVVGGMPEAAMADHDTTYLVLNKRKGFVKMALKHGAHLVPSFTFGENDLYEVRYRVFPGTKLGLFRRACKWAFGYPPVLASGRFGLWPYRVPVTTVVGKPIPVEQDFLPSQEKIDKLHSAYVRSLCDLFETYKDKYGKVGDKIVLVE